MLAFYWSSDNNAVFLLVEFIFSTMSYHYHSIAHSSTMVRMENDSGSVVQGFRLRFFYDDGWLPSVLPSELGSLHSLARSCAFEDKSW